MDVHNFAVQNEFGYAETRRQLEITSASMRQGRLQDVVRIPVVVHVVYAVEDQNVSDQQVEAQIEVLNRDFRAVNSDVGTVPQAFRQFVADSMIEFGLATRDPSGRRTSGITRTRTDIERFPLAQVPPGQSRSAYIDRELKVVGTGVVAWPREHYLNVWVCDMGRNPLGYAAFPGSAAWRDGVVIDYTCFGVGGTAMPPYDLGRTATHEVGHWLDLLHIWGDDDGACSHSDNVGDTPNQGGSNGDVPRFPTISCNNGPNGDMFMNYMDYVDDVAMVMFSDGQVRRMQAALLGARSSLLTSPGLQEPDRDADRVRPLARVAAFASENAPAPAQFVFDGVSWVQAPEYQR